jgi:carbon starvation protein
MFGTANQLLAGVALAIATAAMINAGKVRYIWVTLIPMIFVSVTTLYAGWRNIIDNFMPLTQTPGKVILGYVNITMSAIIIICALAVIGESCRRAWRVLVQGRYTISGKPVLVSKPGFRPPDYGKA